MTKQIIIIRKDLKMRRGKEIAQGAHASMSFLTARIKNGYLIPLTLVQQEWLDKSFTKITCYVLSELHLRNIYESAKTAGLEAHLIVDDGKTEFHGIPTATCLAIGPDYSENLDEITLHLPLY